MIQKTLLPDPMKPASVDAFADMRRGLMETAYREQVAVADASYADPRVVRTARGAAYPELYDRVGEPHRGAAETLTGQAVWTDLQVQNLEHALVRNGQPEVQWQDGRPHMRQLPAPTMAAGTLDDVVAEAAHFQQARQQGALAFALRSLAGTVGYKDGGMNGEPFALGGTLAERLYAFDPRGVRYATPGTLEHEAHAVVEPQLMASVRGDALADQLRPLVGASDPNLRDVRVGAGLNGVQASRQGFRRVVDFFMQQGAADRGEAYEMAEPLRARYEGWMASAPYGSPAAGLGGADAGAVVEASTTNWLMQRNRPLSAR
ncbi:MAG TPA: hypothetical protein VF594_00010 [Rubricoccaceae bacterium]|jgi:hypothetical protein